MKTFIPAFLSIAFAAWLGAMLAFAVMDTNWSEWVGEAKQYYAIK